MTMQDVYLNRGLHILALLSCYISSSVIVSSSNCKPQSPFNSPSVHAFFREPVPPVPGGCVTNLEGLLKQVHVINYRSTTPGVTNTDVLLSIDPAPDRTRTRTLTLILNSDVSVSWEVRLRSPDDVDVSLFQFIISDSSSLEFPGHSLESFEVVNDGSLPSRDHHLLTSVTQRFGNVTSFSSVQDADEITLSIQSNEDAECNLSSSHSAVTAYTTENQSILGCSTDKYDLVNGRQIHIIELFSPEKTLNYDSMRPVEVQIQEGEHSEEGAKDTLLILVAQSPTMWKVSSAQIEGSIMIVSNTPVEARGVQFTETRLQETSNIVATKTGLLSWTQEQYGTVMSYSHIRVANQMTVYLQGPAPHVDNHLSGSTELSLKSNLSCGMNTLRITVPIELAEKHGLTPGMVTWSSSDCSAVRTDLGLILEASLQNCSSSITQSHGDTFTVTNEVIFHSTDVTEGSGVGLDPVDDEDDQILDRKSVSCEFEARSGTLPSGLAAASEDPPVGPLDPAVSMYLDVYSDGDYAQRMPQKPYLVETGDMVYFEMGVTRDARLNIVLGDCWIGIPTAKRYIDRIANLTHNGCPVEPSFEYLPIRHPSFKVPPPPGTVRQFTFNVPDISDRIMTFYVYCNLSVCAKSQIEGSKKIVPCSSLNLESSSCQPRKDVNLWPMKKLEIGPFKIPSRVNKHQDISGSQSQSCSNSSGGVQMPGYVFAVILLMAFLIGVFLIGSMWIITTFTRVPSTAESASADNSVINNGHIPNGHIPNGGEPAHEMEAFLQGNRIPHEGLYNGLDPEV